MAALIAACFGLNAYVAATKMSGKVQVAKQMAMSNTEDPAATTAQEIVENKETPEKDDEEAAG